MNTLLGNRIRELRKARAFTQEQVAERLEISRQRYARIENGTNNITLEILIKLAEILGVSVGDITKVLDETLAVAYRAGPDETSSEKIFDMVDLFYANKRLYDRLQEKEEF